MKKTILFLSLIASAAITLNAQCSPDFNQTEVGTSPSNLPPTCENVPYDEAITITVEKNINYLGFNVVANKITITSVENLHSGLSYSCEKSDCSIVIANIGKSHSCISILGTPTETGEKTIKVNYTAEIDNPLGGVSEIENSYEASVNVKASSDADCNLQSVFDNQKSATSLGAYPNPSNGKQLNFINTLHNVTVVDQLGNVIYQIDESRSIQLESVQQGIYFIKADEGIEKIIIK